jgi:uncharacterized membrane protein
MDGFGFLIAVVTFVLALIALNKISKLETRTAQLKLQLGDLNATVEKSRFVAASPETESIASEPALAAAAPSASVDDAAPLVQAALSEPAPEATENAEAANWLNRQEEEVAHPAAPKRDMEQAIASRWFVWIGGAAIAIGGLLFVKYAYDNGLISPTLQVILGIIAGLALVGGGEWVRRKATTAAEQQTSYVPAALSAAGLAILFASIYAAYALYQLIPPLPAFFGLAAVGLGALALSRWQGPLIAALGLIGSYVTPALISSESPSAWSFFPYLLVILEASIMVLRGRNWWWLGYAAIAGSFAWTLLWIKGGPFEMADVWPVGIFALYLGLTSFFGIRGLRILQEESGTLSVPASITAPLSVGLTGLAASTVLLGLLLDHMNHAAPALLLFAIAMAVLVAVAWMKRGVALLAPAAGILMFAALMSWNEVAFHAWTLDEQGIWTWSNSFGTDTASFLRWMLLSAAGFTLAGIAGTLLRPSPINWGALGGGAAFLFVWGAWARTDFLLAEATWSAVAGGFALLLLAGVSAANRRVDDPPANLAAGLLAAGAAALLVMALDRLYDGVWLTIAIAILAFVYAVAMRVLKPRLLGPITVALATFATLRLFVSRELWNDDRTIAWGQHWVIYGYGLPAILFYAASRAVRGAGHERSAIALEGISLGLLISLVSLELRVLIGGGFLYEEPQFLEMSAHILTWLGAAYGLMHRQRFYSSFIAVWGSRVLIAASVVMIVLSSLLLNNPVVNEEPVPGNIVFNALLLAYLAPVILIGLIAMRLHNIGWQALKPAAGALALLLTFAYLTLETKLVFQGRLMQVESLSIAESYAYSAVWLAFALALFVAGIRLGKQYVRMAGLGVMALVVLKVFAVDMSNLEGLFRIASFVGLGLCLVGIGWLYQRFVHRPEAATA